MASLDYSATTFAEAGANDGSITASVTITLTGDTFTGSNGDALGTVTNVPAGLTAVLVRASDTTATLSFTGSAAAHANANDVSNLTVTFGNAHFTGGDAAAVTGATTNNLAINFADPADTTAPEFSSAAVNGTSLVLTYTDANNLDATNIPATSAFSVTAGGLAVAVSSVAVDATAKTVTLTLASAVQAAQYVQVTYTDPTGGNDTNAIQDVAGNDAQTSGSKLVTNNTPTLLSSPNTYVIETTGSPYLWINDNGVSSVVDAAGTQYYGIAAGGKLNLTGASGANSIYLSEFYRSDLTVSRSGATAVFKHGSEEIASISTPTGSSQTIQFKDGSYLTLANADGSAVTLGSQTLTTSFAAIADSAAPTLSWSLPADSGTGVANIDNITLYFNEAVEAGTGNIVISNGTGDTRTIAVTDTTQVTFSGNRVTINPTAELANNTGYYVQIANTAITDLAATPNAYAGINDTTTLNFTTGLIANTALVFDYSDLAALTGFSAHANFAAVPTSPASTSGGSAVVAQGAGVVAATAAHAQFIYNSTDGTLRFDADGTGSAASAIVVGILATGLTATASDFVFVA